MDSVLLNEDKLWLDKYTPDSIDNVVGNNDEITRLTHWISNFTEYRDNSKPIMAIEGDCGSGKSLIAELILKKHDYRVIRVSEDDIETNDISESLYRAITYRNIFDMYKGINRTAVIVDDLDKLNLKRNPKTSSKFFSILDTKKCKTPIQVPIICTYTKTSKAITRLVKMNCKTVLKKRTDNDMIKIVKDIVKRDGKCSIDKKTALYISTLVNGDVRKLINLMYTIINNGESPQSNSEKQIKKSKKRKITITSIKNIKNNLADSLMTDSATTVVQSILSSQLTDILSNEKTDEILSNVEGDPFLIPFIIYENYQLAVYNNDIITRRNGNKNGNKKYNINKHLIKASELFNECNKYWSRVYTLHDYEFSYIISYLSSIGLVNTVSYEKMDHDKQGGMDKNKNKNKKKKEKKLPLSSIKYSSMMSKTSSHLKKDKKLRLSSLVLGIHLTPALTKELAEYIYMCLTMKRYKNIAKSFIENRIPYEKIGQNGKMHSVIQKSLSILLSILDFKSTIRITKKIEESILKYIKQYNNI